MKRELFYLSLAAAGFTHPSAVSAGEKPKQRPNVIIIFADDLGWAELGCYGNTFNETPHSTVWRGAACGSPTPMPRRRSPRRRAQD